MDEILDLETKIKSTAFDRSVAESELKSMSNEEIVTVNQQRGTTIDLLRPKSGEKNKILVYIPGAGLNSKSGLLFYNFFISKGFAVAGLNLSGVNQKYNGSAAIGWNDYMEDVSLSIKKIVGCGYAEKDITLVGHSLGGVLAINEAKQKSYDAVVCLAGCLTNETLNIKPSSLGQPQQLEKDGAEISITMSDLKNWFTGENCPDALAEVYKDIAGNISAKTKLESYSLATACTKDDLAETRGLAIAGSKDKSMPSALNKKTADLLNFNFKEINGGHMLPLSDNSNEVFESILSFLNNR